MVFVWIVAWEICTRHVRYALSMNPDQPSGVYRDCGHWRMSVEDLLCIICLPGLVLLYSKGIKIPAEILV